MKWSRGRGLCRVSGCASTRRRSWNASSRNASSQTANSDISRWPSCGRILEHLKSGPGATMAPPRRSKRALLAGTAAALAAVIAAGYWALSTPGTPKLTETDTIVLSDFTNTTGDAVFDDALRRGLIVQLQQSPFLHVLSDQRVRRVIAMMGQPPDARLTPAVALEVCERSSSAAVIEGSIASLGNQYVLGLRATDCRSGRFSIRSSRKCRARKTCSARSAEWHVCSGRGPESPSRRSRHMKNHFKKRRRHQSRR